MWEAGPAASSAVSASADISMPSARRVGSSMGAGQICGVTGIGGPAIGRSFSLPSSSGMGVGMGIVVAAGSFCLARRRKKMNANMASVISTTGTAVATAIVEALLELAGSVFRSSVVGRGGDTASLGLGGVVLGDTPNSVVVVTGPLASVTVRKETPGDSPVPPRITWMAGAQTRQNVVVVVTVPSIYVLITSSVNEWRQLQEPRRVSENWLRGAMNLSRVSQQAARDIDVPRAAMVSRFARVEPPRGHRTGLEIRIRA